MRVLQAPTETLPELAEFLEPFHVHFARSEGPAALERYLTGLLDRAPQQELRHHRPGRPRHLRAAPPGPAHRRWSGTRTTSTASGSGGCSPCPPRATAS